MNYLIHHFNTRSNACVAFSAQTRFVRRLLANSLPCGLAAVAAVEDINPECILPMCERVGTNILAPGSHPWFLEDQIVLQVGFAKAPHQAACLKIDIEGVLHGFVHVKHK